MQKLWVILISVVSLFLGWVIGYFGWTWFQIELKREIGLGDVLNFSATAFFALLVGSYLQKSYGDKRVEKDQLINQTKESLSFLRESKEIFNSCYEKKEISKDNQKILLALLRNLINSITQTKNCLEICKYKKDSQSAEKLKEIYKEYKRALTGGNFPAKPYDGADFNSVETNYGRLFAALNQLIFDINRR